MAEDSIPSTNCFLIQVPSTSFLHLQYFYRMILAGICFCAMMAGASSQPIWFRYTDAPATASSTANTSSTSAVSPTTTTPPITTAGPEFQTIFPSSGILPQAVEIKDPDVMDAIYNTLTPTMQAHVEEVRQKLGVMLFYLGDNKCVVRTSSLSLAIVLFSTSVPGTTLSPLKWTLDSSTVHRRSGFLPPLPVQLPRPPMLLPPPPRIIAPQPRLPTNRPLLSKNLLPQQLPPFFLTFQLFLPYKAIRFC